MKTNMLCSHHGWNKCNPHSCSRADYPRRFWMARDTSIETKWCLVLSPCKLEFDPIAKRWDRDSKYWTESVTMKGFYAATGISLKPGEQKQFEIKEV